MKVKKLLAGFLSVAMVTSALTVGASAAATTPDFNTNVGILETKMEAELKAKASDSSFWERMGDTAVGFLVSEGGTKTFGAYTVTTNGSDITITTSANSNATLTLTQKQIETIPGTYAQKVNSSHKFPSDASNGLIRNYFTNNPNGKELYSKLISENKPDFTLQYADSLRDDATFTMLLASFRTNYLEKATLGEVLGCFDSATITKVQTFLKAIDKPSDDNTKLSELITDATIQSFYTTAFSNSSFKTEFDSKLVNQLNLAYGWMNHITTTGGGTPTGVTTPPVTPVTPDHPSYASDTNSALSVDGAYTFKITSKDGKTPVFVVGTPGIFTVQLVKQSGNDYFYKITAIGVAGAQAGVYVNGTKLLVATVKSGNLTFVSDTGAPLFVNSAYTFKITSKNGKAPVFVVGTPGIFTTQLVKHTGSDYFYKITAIGAPADQAGVYVNGTKLLVATVKTNPSYVLSDTHGNFKVISGKTYVFKLTANAKPNFWAGTSSAFKVSYVNRIGNNYYFRVTAVGKAGSASGFYIQNQKGPVAIATVA